MTIKEIEELLANPNWTDMGSHMYGHNTHLDLGDHILAVIELAITSLNKEIMWGIVDKSTNKFVYSGNFSISILSMHTKGISDLIKEARQKAIDTYIEHIHVHNVINNMLLKDES